VKREEDKEQTCVEAGTTLSKPTGNSLELRNQAQELCRQRAELFGRAAQQYRMGNITGRGAAMYFSEQVNFINSGSPTYAKDRQFK
jgi:hypothetical protein